ncbi:OmpA family protein [Niveispirillum sp. KHB5.9]|uniref:OmpA family protein n=1 Tax=Niveispirillum sp. KHB5.9 TaxID=3400269 RepID=UPI003A85941B
MYKPLGILICLAGLAIGAVPAIADDAVPVYETVDSLTGCQAMLKLAPRVPGWCLPKKGVLYSEAEVAAQLGASRGAPFRSLAQQTPLDKWVPNTPSPGLNVRPLQFDHDATVLTREAKGLLYEVETVLMTVPGISFRVEGHTNNKGGRTYNQGLSERRVASVIGYLPRQYAGRLYGRAYGMTRLLPGRPGGDPLNRRVELIPVIGSEVAL